MAAQVFWAVFYSSRAKSAQQLISTMLPFHPLYFPWIFTEGEGDGIESSLSSQVFSTKVNKKVNSNDPERVKRNVMSSF